MAANDEDCPRTQVLPKLFLCFLRCDERGVKKGGALTQNNIITLESNIVSMGNDTEQEIKTGWSKFLPASRTSNFASGETNTG